MARRFSIACERSGLVVALMIYIGLAVWLGYLRRDQLNPDAVCYLRNAQYLADGRIADSISSYWSPLLSWCIAPLVCLGIDSVHAARWVLGIWGAATVLASYCLLRSLLPRAGALGAVGLCVISVYAAQLATKDIVPDVCLAAMLLAYCAAAASRRFVHRSAFQLLAGGVAGLAYLAKAYALPFFLVHFTFTAYHRILARDGVRNPCRASLAWLRGMCAFLIIVAPWIAVLSAKHGKLTIATAGRAAHAIIGPPDKPRDHDIWRLRPIAKGRICVWETPEVLRYNEWSPWESRAYFLHQVRYAYATTQSIFSSIGRYDFLGMCLPAFFLAPIVMSRPHWNVCRRRSFWIAATAGIYASGFVLVFWEDRYTRPFVFPLGVLHGGILCPIWFRRSAARLGVSLLSRKIAVAVVSGSFVAGSLFPLYIFGHSALRLQGTWRRIAVSMKNEGCQGGIASLGVSFESLYLAYQLDEPYFGVPETGDASEIEEALRDNGARTLVVDGDAEGAAEFSRRTTWESRFTFKREDGVEVKIYRPPQGPGGFIGEREPQAAED